MRLRGLVHCLGHDAREETIRVQTKEGCQQYYSSDVLVDGVTCYSPRPRDSHVLTNLASEATYRATVVEKKLRSAGTERKRVYDISSYDGGTDGLDRDHA